MTWQSALEQTLKATYISLARDQVQWAVIGSVASALQGCQVIPNDIDFLAAEPEGVYCFAELMAGYTSSKCDYPPSDKNWHSSGELPVRMGSGPAGFLRYIGRWYVDGFKIEMAHLAALGGGSASPAEAGMWEFGPDIWPFLRQVPFAGYQIPVTPLEIQLGTNLRRGLKDRVEGLITLFRERGYDQAILQRSLGKEQLEVFTSLMQE